MVKLMVPVRRNSGGGSKPPLSHFVAPGKQGSLCGLVPLAGWSDRVSVSVQPCQRCARAKAAADREADRAAFERASQGEDFVAIMARPGALERVTEIQTHSLFRLRCALRGLKLAEHFSGFESADPGAPVTFAGVPVRENPLIPCGVVVGLGAGKDACGKRLIRWAGGIDPQGVRVAPVFAERRRRDEVREIERQARADNPAVSQVVSRVEGSPAPEAEEAPSAPARRRPSLALLP